ncbi:MAG: hypothetical protein QOJ79_2666 [Actinomycetota bacterium]|jgi:GAF domain-containing protein|nr:hypothetical protein [Actinomycetota bacterium]
MEQSPPMPPADVVAVLDAVSQAALQGLASAVAVSVTLVNDYGARTAAASSRWPDAVDEAQYIADSGPCLDAAVTGETFWMTDVDIETRWPAYVEAAAARGARSSLSVPIPVDDGGVVGSLNAFSLMPDAFSEVDENALTRLAGTAAAALMTADIGSFLHRSRAVVDQARGIVMFAEGCTSDQALQSLRHTAHESGRSLRQVCGDLIRETTAP